MITTHNNIFCINTLSYNKNNDIYNTNNTIFDLNTLKYKRKNNIYNTHYYINTCEWAWTRPHPILVWASTRPDPTWGWARYGHVQTQLEVRHGCVPQVGR